MYLLGIDVGSSTVKAGIHSCTGELACLFAREYEEVYPRPGWREIDPNVLWNTAAACIREVLAKSGVNPGDILAVSVSARGEEVAPLDRNGSPLYNFITAMDLRDNHYRKIIEMWRREMDPRRLYEKTGVTLTTLPTIYRIIWIKQNKPEIFSAVHKFCCVEDFILYKLSGEYATDYSMAGRTMAFNRNTKTWDRDILDIAGIRENMLCAPYNAGSVVGKVNKQGAAETGLSTQTYVVAGGHDQCCAALGAGAVDAGCVFNGLGTVESVCVVADEAVSDPSAHEKHQACYPHVVRGKYLVHGGSMAFGLAIRWLRDNVFRRLELPEGASVYDQIMMSAASIPHGCHGLFFLPHFQGSSTGISPAFNAKSRACLIGLRKYHSNADICRAVLEGLCLESKAIISAIETTYPIRQMRATGGPTRSDFFMQLKTDITNKEIQVLRTNEAGVVGASILAGLGAGVYRTCAEALPYFHKIRKTFVPDRSEHEFYEKVAAIYDRLYPSLLEIFERIADSALEAGD